MSFDMPSRSRLFVRRTNECNMNAHYVVMMMMTNVKNIELSVLRACHSFASGMRSSHKLRVKKKKLVI